MIMANSLLRGGHNDDVQGLNRSWIMSAFLHGWEVETALDGVLGVMRLLDLGIMDGALVGWILLA